MSFRTESQTTLLFYVLFLLILNSSTRAAPDCPSECVCKWIGGKQTVACVNASLNRIPDIRDVDTQVLDLSHNYLPVLPAKIFLAMGLPNLQKVFLAHSSVRVVEDYCFSGLSNLIELDLGHNALASVPLFTIDDCKYLMRLSLRGNLIREVNTVTFRDLSDLNSLDLAENNIEVIQDGAFSGLKNLAYLRLEGNRIVTLAPWKTFPPKLR